MSFSERQRLRISVCMKGEYCKFIIESLIVHGTDLTAELNVHDIFG